jgi:L-glyceraldehyde 3-phosphate reductase
LLTDRYLGGIPDDSRAGKPNTGLVENDVSDKVLAKVRQLNQIARARGQSMAQMAVAWILRQPAITSVLIGASRTSQIEQILAARDNLQFSTDELSTIDQILAGS